MLPIYSSTQIKEIEKLTCIEQKIESLQLMERAGQVFTLWFCSNFKDKTRSIQIFCGHGNNGGDGLVIARLLYISGYKCNVVVVEISNTTTSDFDTNLEKLKTYESVEITKIEKDKFILPEINPKDIIIDAILGTGVHRQIEEPWKKLINFINSKENLKVSVDLPSGLPTDSIFEGIAIQSDFIFGFEYPKLSYLLPEHGNNIKQWQVESIQLTKNISSIKSSSHYLIERKDIKNIIKPRNKFSYKNNFGHALVIAGSKTMCGASHLVSRSVMRSGAGLVTVTTDANCKVNLFQQFPEAMIQDYEDFFPLLLNKFDSICIGPGMMGIDNMEAMINKCINSGLPLILDAEAILTLSSHPNLLKKLPKNSILTPHVGEFEKLVNKKFENSINRLQAAKEFAIKHKLILIIKGTNTCINTSDGKQIFNSTGNQGMATAGSGDVLAGIIGGLLAQQYEPLHAALIGVYLHGLAGDLALQKQSSESMIATDIIENLGEAFKELEPKELF